MTAEAPVRPDAAGLGSPAWGGFDPARTRGRGWIDLRRSFTTAARLGWQMEANWTDPVLFFTYSVAKPLASALIRFAEEMDVTVVAEGIEKRDTSAAQLGKWASGFVKGMDRMRRLVVEYYDAAGVRNMRATAQIDKFSLAIK
jgi:hypothetical protein